jgi:hypothetical protein
MRALIRAGEISIIKVTRFVQGSSDRLAFLDLPCSLQQTFFQLPQHFPSSLQDCLASDDGYVGRFIHLSDSLIDIFLLYSEPFFKGGEPEPN